MAHGSKILTGSARSQEVLMVLAQAMAQRGLSVDATFEWILRDHGLARTIVRELMRQLVAVRKADTTRAVDPTTPILQQLLAFNGGDLEPKIRTQAGDWKLPELEPAELFIWKLQRSMTSRELERIVERRRNCSHATPWDLVTVGLQENVPLLLSRYTILNSMHGHYMPCLLSGQICNHTLPKMGLYPKGSCILIRKLIKA